MMRTRTPGDDPLGREYLLQEVIGRGAWAVVRRATCRSGGPDLVAKLLRPQYAGDRYVRDLLLREEAVLRELDHPAIVGLRDLVVESGQIALLMEFVDGPNLRRYVVDRGGRLPAADVGAVGAQVAAALAAAHAHGVVHLDLKPENVLVARGSGRLVVKLGDFGVAALLSEAGGEVSGGTPGYIAPEVLAGRPATTAADVFALGVMLAELATGVRPGAGPAGLPELPGGLRGLVHSCLATDPRDRPSARSVAAHLRTTRPADRPAAGPAVAGSGAGTWLNETRLRRPGGPGPATGTGPATPRGDATGRRRRHRRTVAWAVAALAALATLTGFTVNAAAANKNAAAADKEIAAPTATTAPPAVPAKAATTPPAATEAPDRTRATYAAHLPDGGGTLYLALRDGVAIAYLCDGKRLEAWFRGSAADGKFRLTGKKGATLQGSFTADRASGEVTVGGESRLFSIPAVHKPSALYRAAAKVRNAEVKGGWIVLPDGRQVGVLQVDGTPQPAPPLDTANGAAVVDGDAISAAPIDIDRGTGF